MSNTYSVNRILGTGASHHNNKWGVIRTPAHSDSGKDIFVAAGDMAKERAEYVAAMFSRERSADDERFLQSLLAGEPNAEALLRELVGAKPRSTSRGRDRSPFTSANV